jgi:hypothetical protein
LAVIFLFRERESRKCCVDNALDPVDRQKPGQCQVLLETVFGRGEQCFYASAGAAFSVRLTLKVLPAFRQVMAKCFGLSRGQGNRRAEPPVRR